MYYKERETRNTIFLIYDIVVLDGNADSVTDPKDIQGEGILNQLFSFCIGACRLIIYIISPIGTTKRTTLILLIINLQNHYNYLQN